MESLKQFLESIKPQKSGVLALVVSLLVLPFFADVFLFSLAGKIKNEGDVTLSQVIISGCIKMLPWLLLYLLIFFAATFFYNKYFKKKSP